MLETKKLKRAVRQTKSEQKRFSLFNVGRWCLFGKEPKIIDNPNPTLIKSQDILPACCGLVPVLYEGAFNHENIHNTLKDLELNGSSASPGFMNPEGIIIFHTASRYLFKKTIKNDEKPKYLSLHTLCFKISNSFSYSS